MPGSFTTPTISAAIAEGSRFDDDLTFTQFDIVEGVRNMFPHSLLKLLVRWI